MLSNGLAESDRKKAHRTLDSIYSDLFSAIDDQPLTFQQLSEEVFRRRNEVIGLVLAGALHYEASLVETSIRCQCVQCDRPVTRHRQKRSILQSINGTVSFTRNYFYCRACRIGFCPSDQMLHVIPRKLQFDVQKKIVEFAVKLPFDEAIKELKAHYAVTVNKKVLHELTQAVSEHASVMNGIPDREVVLERLTTLRKGSKRRVVVVIGIDGAFVPIRPNHKGRKGRRGAGFWREAKGIRIYAIADQHIHHILTWHQIQDADQAEQCLGEILATNIIPVDIARVCVCADGAKWIWKRVQHVFPDAKLVLDYYHCSEHICDVAKEYFKNDVERKKWIIMAKERLFAGEVLILVKRLRRMRSEDKAVEHKIQRLANYLDERAEMTMYSAFRKGGYPIGSGGIESSNKNVCHKRMKISGAWWKETMANAMLRLRSCHANDALGKVFTQYANQCLKEYFPHQIERQYN